MPSKATDAEKTGWTTSWSWVRAASDWTWRTCSWTATEAWNISLGTGKALKEGTEKVLSAASKEDLLEVAKKPETKALASESGKLVNAVAEGNITGVVTSTANITLNFLKPGLADDRLIAGSFVGATLGSYVCGPPCAVAAGVAGGLYGHLRKPEKGEDEECENEKEACDATEENVVLNCE